MTATVIALATGLVAGTLGGMLGVGGGLVIIPAMVLLAGVSQHTAQGISLVVIVPTALVGALVHYRQGNVDLRTALLIAPTAAAFAALGAWASSWTTGPWLTRAFAIFLLVAGFRMVFFNRGGQDVKAP